MDFRDTLTPGDIVVLSVAGAVEVKRRPVVVLSGGEYHREHPDVVVGFITTRVGEATTSADHVLQDWTDAGLMQPSAFRAYLVTRWRRDITRYVGRLSQRDWEAVRQCVRRALELD